MKKNSILTWLTLAVVLAVSSCGSVTPVIPPAAQAPAADALKEVVAYTLPASTPAKDWTIPLRAAPLKEIQKYPSDKFPEGWPQGTPTPFEVGVAEIGAGAKYAGNYVVAIDIDTEADTVSGLLASTTDANVYLVKFQRIPQVVNPERGKDAKIPAFQSLPDPPSVGLAIRADSLCFVVETKQNDPGSYFRFCSTDPILSVRDNFSSQYQLLQDSIQKVADGVGVSTSDLDLDQIISEMENPTHIENCGEQLLNPAKAIAPPEPTATPDSMKFNFEPPADAAVPGTPKPSLSFSEGGTPAPESAALFQASCGSDITVASVTLDYFDQQYKSLPAPTGSRPFMFSLLAPFFQGGPTPITVAVVQILQPVDTVLGTVFPGNYRLDYWFNPGNVFYAATITGTLASNNAAVTNQPVPAVPATFVNTNGSEQGGAQISTCRIFGRCTFFQSSCS